MSNPRSPSSSGAAGRSKVISLSSPQPIVTITAQVTTMSVIDLTPPPQTFTVHKAFICHHSKFFASAFSGKSTEALTGKMVLENTDPRVFGLLVNWLYFQTIEHDKKNFRVDHMVFLHHMGLRFSIPKLQNDVIALIHQAITDESVVSKELYFTKAMSVLWEERIAYHRITDMMVGSLIWGSKTWINTNLKAWVPWMTVKLAERFRTHYNALPEALKIKAPSAAEFQIIFEKET